MVGYHESDDAQKVLLQMADVFAAIQAFQLPESLEGKIGGVTFGDSRDFISAPLAVLDGGPYDMYEEYWAVFLKAQLKDADGEGAFVGGRKDSGLRERLDRSIEGDGIRNLLEGVELDERRLVHPDFSKFHHFSNALPCLPVQWMPLAGTDTETLDLTALLDLDFAYTSHPADEFLRSLSTNFGDVPSPNTCKAPHNEPPAELDRAALLCRFLLHGFPSSDLLPQKIPPRTTSFSFLSPQHGMRNLRNVTCFVRKRFREWTNHPNCGGWVTRSHHSFLYMN